MNSLENTHAFGLFVPFEMKFIGNKDKAAAALRRAGGGSHLEVAGVPVGNFE